MPHIKFTEVLTFSSEDPNHPADNLLKSDSYLKWKSEYGRTENQEYLVLKLEKLTCIRSIDIGNENAAYIEVLVSREDGEFKVLLVASSFMSPLESRNGTNTNRVRMFGLDKLNKTIAEQKWDRVKIICTQPFNKNVQYGLTFVKVYAPDEKSSSVKETKLGKFTIYEEEDDLSISVGSLFAERKEKDSTSTGAAAIRAASKIAARVLEQPNALKRSAEEEESSNAPNTDFYQLKKKVRESQERNSPASTPGKPEPKHETKNHNKKTEITKKVDVKTPKHKENKLNPTSNRNSSKAKKKRVIRPFKKLMNDVVFVLSGYQNPQRSKIRDSLIDMGAKYKNDWGKDCTHLICAFKNTPKYQAVKGKGKIVTEKWVEDSYKKKIRFPWQRYSLEKIQSDESEDEIWASEICPDPQNGSEPKTAEKECNADDLTESEDTDDEIQRAIQKNAQNKGKDQNSKKHLKEEKQTEQNSFCDKPVDMKTSSPKSTSDDEYDADTDVDEDDKKRDTSEISLPLLKDIFKQKTFFLYGSLDESKKKSLTRYIIAFQGKVVSYMNEEVSYVITDDSWDENFDNALEDKPHLQFVKSQWIWKCCNSEKMVPPQPFLIVPKDEC